jgi:hypothetical protein
MATFTERMVRAARLDPGVYEEIEADTGAMTQALTVVVLSSLAAGIGRGAGLGGMVVGLVISLVAWYVWAFLTYWIGTRLLPEPQTSSSHGELLRVLGFAAAPGVIQIVGIVPMLRGLVTVVAAVWMLIAGVIAVRQALDYRSTGRAVVVVIIGWIVQWVFVIVLLSVSRHPAF